MTINGKNYQNACRRSYCYYGNGECWWRNRYTSDFDAWMKESEVNLALRWLRLRHYIELRENWAAENCSGPSASIPKLRNSCWKVCNGPCCYLKHGVTKDAFIASQTPVRGAQVLWLVCLCISQPVSPRGYLRNYTCDLYQMFGACCLWSWLNLLLAKGVKFAIYDCLVFICYDYNWHTWYCCVYHAGMLT